VVSHSGAVQSEYNGEFRIFNVTSTTYDFTVVGTPTTPATGTLTAKVAPLGWVKAFSGTNKAAYKASDPAATGFYLRVDDSNEKYAIVAGYESMTDVDTGSGKFDQTTCCWHKSSTADATLRPWELFGDERVFYFASGWYASAPTERDIWMFGDAVSYKSGDAYHCLLSNTGVVSPTNPGQSNTFSRNDAVPSRKCAARSYTQLGGKVDIWSLSLGAGLTYTPYPNPIDNGMHIGQVNWGEGSNMMFRGVLPGVYFPLHSAGSQPAHGTIISDIPEFVGRKFFVSSSKYEFSQTAVVFDITGPWR